MKFLRRCFGGGGAHQPPGLSTFADDELEALKVMNVINPELQGLFEGPIRPMCPRIRVA